MFFLKSEKKREIRILEHWYKPLHEYDIHLCASDSLATYGAIQI